MKYFFKYIYFFLLSFIKNKRFIILNPNLSFFGIRKVYLYDKENKSILNFEIRNKYDLITIEEIFFYESYKLSNINKYGDIKNDINSKKLLIVDCGSNIGCSSIYFLNTYKNSFLISIEPDKENFELLSKNVKKNNTILINNAVSSEEINYEILNTMDNRAKSIIKSDNGKSSLKSLTINKILNDYNRLNFYPFIIKIDIEGHEKELFEKNTEWFDKFKIIIIEIHDWMLPGKAVSKNYFTTLVSCMKKNNRDIIISGENIISIKL